MVNTVIRALIKDDRGGRPLLHPGTLDIVERDLVFAVDITVAGPASDKGDSFSPEVAKAVAVDMIVLSVTIEAQASCAAFHEVAAFDDDVLGVAKAEHRRGSVDIDPFDAIEHPVAVEVLGLLEVEAHLEACGDGCADLPYVLVDARDRQDFLDPADRRLTEIVVLCEVP